MLGGMEKKVIHGPAPESPRTRSWAFNLTFTRSAPDEGGETILALAHRVTPLDLVLILALLTLFIIEPFGVYLYLTRHGGLLSAESCAAGNPNVVVTHSAHGAPLTLESGTGGGSPGFEVGGANDVITPLNVRDPSNLVMGPGVYVPAAAPARADAARARRDADSEWKEALEAAAEKIPDPPKSSGK